MLVRHLIYAQTYLICLIPLALLTGPAIPDILLTLSGIILIIILIKEKDFSYFKNYISLIFFLFCFYLIFISLISDHLSFSIRSSLFYFRFGLITLCIIYLLDNKKNFIKLFTFFLLFSFFVALISGYYQYIFSETLFGAKPIYSNRLLLLFSDQLLLGQYLSRLFPLLLALILFKIKRSKYILIIVFFIFIFTDILIYLSGERTALGILFLSSLIILLLTKSLKLFRFFTLIVSIFFIVIISFASPEIKERNIDETISQLGINEGDKINIFSLNHESHIYSALNMFRESPFIGLGPNNFRKYCNEDLFNYDELSCSTHPHNIYIQLLAETGIIGFMFIFTLFASISYSFMKHAYFLFIKKSFIFSDYQICLLTCLFCSLWPILPTLNFFNNWINIIYYLPVGFIIHSFYKKESKESRI